MLSKKRQIMFEVMGRRARQSHAPEPVRPEPVRAAPRRKKRKPITLPSLQGRSWWFSLAGVVLLGVVFVVYRVNRSVGAEVPVLQMNTEHAMPPADAAGEPQPAHTFAVCAMSRDFGNRTERKRAAEKVQEIVNFLGYHSDPDFRDVRADPGKDAERGTFRVYVGSARSRSELVPLKDKLAALIWNRSRPFQNATVKLVEGAAALPGSKEVADER